MRPPATTPRILLIEDDRDTREAVTELMEDEGFSVRTTSSVVEALALVDKQSYSLILSDLWDRGQSRWDDIAKLVSLADPTPVAVCTAARGRPPAELSSRLAFFLEKPFPPEQLLQLLARHAGNTELVERYRQSAEAYFAALTNKDWGALGQLCADDVQYHFPTPHPSYGRQVTGKEAFLAFSRETFDRGPFADARFEVRAVSPLEGGVLADWASEWNLAAQPPGRSEGSIVLKFVDGRLHRIGVRLDVDRWARMIGAPAPA